ncbi:MAG: hypothetical protein AAF541_05520 [Pseudomonadota bacterium]
MLSKSLVATILSLPATVAVIGVFLVTVPAPSLHLPALLMVFPIWVAIACGVYQIPKTSHAAAVLVLIAVSGYGIITLLKSTGVSAL